MRLPLASLACGALALAPLHATSVSIELILSPGLTTNGGNIEYDLYSYPNWNSKGDMFFKSRFLDFTEELAKSGYVFHDLNTPNTANPVLRDDTGDFASFQFSRFGLTDAKELFFDSPTEEDANYSLFRFANGATTKIAQRATLIGVAPNGSAVAQNFAEISTIDIGRVASGGGSLTSIVKSGQSINGVENATIKSFGEIHYNPNGRIAFVAVLQGDGIDFTNDHALIRENADGSLEVVARETSKHPVSSELVVDGVYKDLQESAAAFGFNRQGHVAFKASISDDSSEFSDRTTSLWFAAPGSDPQFIARVGAATQTSNAGSVEFTSFRAGNSSIGRQPILDASGNVFFLATTTSEEDQEPVSIFKWDGTSISKIIELNKSLPLPEIENPVVDPQNIAISSSGRIALYGIVKNGSSSLAAVLWAQDDKGVFTTVASFNLSQTTFERENLVTTGGDLGKITRIFMPPQEVNAAGAEDGISTLWWTPDERVLFSARTTNSGSKAYYCLATVGEPKIPASGDKYTWDGGIETTAWEGIDSGRTNWVDTIGARWDLPPNRSNAEVIIPGDDDSVVISGGNVEVGSLDSNGSIELLSDLTVRGDAKTFDISLENSATFKVEGDLIQTGLVSSSGNGIDFAPNTPGKTASTSGTILAEKIGVNAISEHSFTIDNRADMNTDGFAGIFAESNSGDITVENSAGIETAHGPAIHLRTPQGAIEFNSQITPEESLKGLTDSGIILDAKNSIFSTIEGDIIAIAENSQEEHAGLFVRSSSGPVTLDLEGEISATNTIGVSARGAGFVSVTQQGIINSTFDGIIANSTASDVFVDSRQSRIAGDLGGILAISDLGATTVRAGEISANGGHAISAQGENRVAVYASQEINVIDVQSAIEAISSSGKVLIDSSASISAFGSSNPGAGISVTAAGDIDITQRALMSTSFFAIGADSIDGHIKVDTSTAIIDADYGGLFARTANGSVELKTGPMNIGQGDAIEAKAKGDVTIVHNGDIFVIGDGNSQLTAFGIDAESTEGSIEINSNGVIDTIHNGISTAISALAKQDININSTGSLSTYDNGTMWANSTDGSIQITHRGDILATNKGRGLWAQAPKGSIIISLLDQSSLLASRGAKNAALLATAEQSISVLSRASIRSTDNEAPSVSLTSTTAGVSFTSHNDILAGSESEAILVNSPTISTVTLLGGDIISAGGSNSVIQFVGGTQNKLTNHASIEAFDGSAIKAEDADVTINNHKSIIGDIVLGTGTNIVNNHIGSVFSPDENITLGSDGSISNSGTLDLTRGGEFTLTGSILFSDTSTLLIKQTSATLSNWLNASKESTLGGSVVFQLDPDINTAPDQSFQIMTALGLTETFNQVHLAPLGLDNQEAVQFARQFPSRENAISLNYTTNDVSVTLSELAIDDYESWSAHFIPGDPSSDPSAPNTTTESGLLADPDQDGLSNLEEYAFGTHPLQATKSPFEYQTAHTHSQVSSKHLLRFPWIGENQDLEWALQKSNNLKQWESVEIQVANSEKIGEITFLTIEPEIEAEKSFLRLKITYISDSN